MNNRFTSHDADKMSGDLMRRSSRLKLDIYHCPADDDEPAHIHVDFELHGTAKVAADSEGDNAAFVRELFRAFRDCERINDDDQEGGAV